VIGIRSTHPADDLPADRALAVELAGYLDAAVGVGEAARRYVEALRSVDVPVLERDVPLPGRDRAMAELPAGPKAAPEAVAFNLMCLNPEQLMPYLGGPEAPPRAGRVTIGIWSWEVDVLPPGWSTAAAELAEIWTYSRFGARLISDALGVPVVGIPPPVSLTAKATQPTMLVPGGFRILVMFDYLSTLERKNPLGAIDAYRRAFGPDDGATLIVKSVNGRHRTERHAEMADRAGGRRDIVLLDRVMSTTERDALVASCDCYLSLHRSEGHGMPLAEAMASGKPVVATAYGGNTEFMSEENSYLVNWKPTPVGAGVEHYPAAASWAEPDVEHAARLLRAVRDDSEGRRRRVAQAQVDIQTLLSPKAVGGQMRDRLRTLERARSASQQPRRYARKRRLLGRG
jgi:glycosyltransferase involved in cell wall biosynthesis